MNDPANPVPRPKAMSREEKRQMKSAARLYAVQALFQMEASGQTLDAVRQEFETHRFGAVYEGEEMAEGDPDLFSQDARGCAELAGEDRPDDRPGARREMAHRPDRPDAQGAFPRGRRGADRGGARRPRS